MAATPTASVLNSWKEIAQYLGRGIRTVQRYEREAQLPVRRLGVKSRSAVLALPQDLDNWLKHISKNDGVLTAGHFADLDPIQIHLNAMHALESNLRRMQQQLLEARRIRTRRRWFGESPLDFDVDRFGGATPPPDQKISPKSTS